MKSLQIKIKSLTGFKKYAAAFGFGGVMTLSLPPVGFFPILLLSVPAFIWLAQASSSRRDHVLTGWAFGAGYFIFGFYWVSAALFVDIGQWGWVLPLSLIVGPGLFGLYYGLIPLIARRFRDDAAVHGLAMVLAWTAIEYTRGHLMTGFPWNLPGYSWMWMPALEQTAAFGGAYLLTLLTLFWAAMPVLRHNRHISAVALATLATALSFGAFRLMLLPTTYTDTIIRIGQPNIPQNMKWDSNEEWRNFETIIGQAREPGVLKPSIFIWPETAINADLTRFPDIAAHIARQLPEDGVAILGNLRITETKEGRKYYNSVSVLSKKAKVLATYDKHHLVPFGEYIPFRKQIKIAPIAAAVSGIGDFTPGSGVETLHTAGIPAFSPLICYEVIFPARVASRTDRPEWLVNVTNDGWYGGSFGPYQHMEITRMRAIEEGLPLARAANTGISALFDPLGRTIIRQPLLTKGVIDAALPKPLPPTLYSLWGDLIFWACFAIFSLWLLFIKKKNLPQSSI